MGFQLFNGNIDDVMIYSRGLNDTIPVLDTTFVFDTIYISDTVPVFDTVEIQQYISVTDTLIIDLPLSDNPQENPQIKIYPNPAKEKLIISITNQTAISEYRIKIYNPTGVQIFEVLLTNPEIELDIGQFGEAGLYILQIFNELQDLIDARKILIE